MYIGRGDLARGLDRSKWHNPFAVKRFGRKKCLRMFEKYLSSSSLVKDLNALSGRVLRCHCAPGTACHADVLIAAWRSASTDLSQGDVAIRHGVAHESNPGPRGGTSSRRSASVPSWSAGTDTSSSRSVPSSAPGVRVLPAGLFPPGFSTTTPAELASSSRICAHECPASPKSRLKSITSEGETIANFFQRVSRIRRRPSPFSLILVRSLDF